MKHLIAYTQKELDTKLLNCSEKEAALQQARELIKSGANVNCFESTRGNTPLIKASNQINHSIIKLLLENGADVNLGNKNGKNCLFYVVSQNNYIYYKYQNKINNIIDLMMNYGINLNSKNKSGLDIFSNIQESNQKILQYIIDNYPDKYKEYTMKKITDKFNI